MHTIATLEKLEKIYSVAPVPAALVKEKDRLTPEYATLINASPFVVLATSGPEGLDCSPRGDTGSVVRIENETTLLLPDRRGNNRIDSLRNIVRDSRIALLFLIPGSGTTFRVNGSAVLSTEPSLLDSFAVEGQLPRSVIVITIERCYFQCARAVLRAELWNAEKHIDAKSLPSAGEMFAACSSGEVGGENYDRDWPARAAKSMW
jgi:PPOX class probable FMN-dependent enzyme